MLEQLPPATRLAFRARIAPIAIEAPQEHHPTKTDKIARTNNHLELSSNLLGLEQALGFALPHQIGASTTAQGRTALKLGPDEWLLLAPTPDRGLAPAIEAALTAQPHALVDISHRQRAFRLTGPGAAATLNAACPLDLAPAAFPPGRCTRTVFAKTEIILWRTAADAFHIEVWRSFAPYLRAMLEQAEINRPPC